ncbi:MAG: NUDIX hydrolase [Clostridia bacterium]|nr:NUDIX hydrolase [Clostridia bacterium]
MHKTLASAQIHVAVDLMIVTVRDGKMAVLLSRRPQAPCAGCWALPGHLLPLEESAETAAESLLREMLPIDGAYREQLFTFTDVSRDPRGRVISIAYLVLVPWQRLEGCLTREEVKLACFTVCDDAKQSALVGPETILLDGPQLAFDHGQIIRTGIRRLQGKISYTDVGFHFLQSTDAFSLRELQMIFEAVLGEEMDKSNFRRSILARYETTGHISQTEDIQKSGRGRPAVLYRYIP